MNKKNRKARTTVMFEVQPVPVNIKLGKFGKRCRKISKFIDTHEWWGVAIVGAIGVILAYYFAKNFNYFVP
jgi:hypothetical protein